MRGLLYRCVTVPSDEPLIIATLLALSLGPILASEHAERINVLWRIIGTSPCGINKHILFLMGPRIHERGLRWAPRSLLPAGFRISVAKPAKWLLEHLAGPGMLVFFKAPSIWYLGSSSCIGRDVRRRLRTLLALRSHIMDLAPLSLKIQNATLVS